MIKDMKDGGTYQLLVICTKKTLSKKKNGEDYYSFELRDKSGSITAKAWDTKIVPDFKVGDVLKVHGKCSLWEEKLQLTLNYCCVAEDGTYNIEDLCPTADYDVEQMFSSLMNYVNCVKDPLYADVLTQFFGDSGFLDRIKKHSAAVHIHHATVGGWLQHTLAVTKHCYSCIKIYPYLNSNLLLTAAILHDIGKLFEISSFPENNYTDVGYLIGHISYGYSIVKEACEKSVNYDRDKALKLQHCILAHHGELEYGSPKKPAIIEAVVLSFADNMDSKIQIAHELIERGELNDGPHYDKYLGTYFQK